MPAIRHVPHARRLPLSLIASAVFVTSAAADIARAQSVPEPARVAEAKPIDGREFARAESRATTAVIAVAPQLHANAEHPGLTQWRRANAGQQPIDGNHFLVLPPASARWVSESAQ